MKPEIKACAMRALTPCLGCFFASLAQADDTNVFLRFPDFSRWNGVEFHGAATNVTSADGPVLRLVPAQTGRKGSALSTNEVSAAAFSTFFTFRFTSAGGLGGGADGFVFVITGSSQDFGPGGGGGMGYFGMTNTVGVEFDIYHNPEAKFDDPNGNHVAINTGGLFDADFTETATVSPSMKNGEIWFAWIDYDGSVLEVRVSDIGIRPPSATVARALIMTDMINSQTATVGFTASTGDGYANHDILAWQLNSTYSPIPAVLPAVSLKTYAVGSNQYPGLSITGSVGSYYQIQYVEQLANTNTWNILTDVELTGNPLLWLEQNTPANGIRFYRVIPQ